jgi:hypothetical protein
LHKIIDLIFSAKEGLSLDNILSFSNFYKKILLPLGFEYGNTPEQNKM